MSRVNPRASSGIERSGDDRDYHGRETRQIRSRCLEELRREGFLQTYVWQDAPGTLYPQHTRATETTHVVLGRRHDLDEQCPQGGRS